MYNKFEAKNIANCISYTVYPVAFTILQNWDYG